MKKSIIFLLVVSLSLQGCAVLSSKEMVVGCQVADVVTTKIALSHGAVEANPIVAGVFNHAGWPAFILIKVIVTLVLLEIREDNKEVVAAANVITCGAAINNALSF